MIAFEGWKASIVLVAVVNALLELSVGSEREASVWIF